MDCTYAYQPGFTQTMIIMYYDIIVFKFIPEKISEGEKLKSIEYKFPTIVKAIVQIFGTRIGNYIMNFFKKKYYNEDLRARQEIANELTKFCHAIKQINKNESKKIKFCDVEIKVKNKGDREFSIKNDKESFTVSRNYFSSKQ